MRLYPEYLVSTEKQEISCATEPKDSKKPSLVTVITLRGNFTYEDIADIENKYPGCRFTFERYESPDAFVRRLEESANLCVGIDPANGYDSAALAFSFDNGRGERIFTVPRDCGAARAAADTKGANIEAKKEEAMERAMDTFAEILGFRVYR